MRFIGTAVPSRLTREGKNAFTQDYTESYLLQREQLICGPGSTCQIASTGSGGFGGFWRVLAGSPDLRARAVQPYQAVRSPNQSCHLARFALTSAGDNRMASSRTLATISRWR
jgi:hypothetical protein